MSKQTSASRNLLANLYSYLEKSESLNVPDKLQVPNRVVYEEGEEEEEELEEREAGETETEDLDDEGNPNRSESSDAVCLDSDSEETNQYSPTRDNFSVSDVRKEQVQIHKMCIRDRCNSTFTMT